MGEISGGKTWEGLEPTTRAVVVAFLGHVGEEDGQLGLDDFAATALTAFPDMAAVSMRHVLEEEGPAGVRELILNRLMDPEERSKTREVIADLVALAGGDERAIQLGKSAVEALEGGELDRVSSILKILSALVVSQQFGRLPQSPDGFGSGFIGVVGIGVGDETPPEGWQRVLPFDE